MHRDSQIAWYSTGRTNLCDAVGILTACGSQGWLNEHPQLEEQHILCILCHEFARAHSHWSVQLDFSAIPLSIFHSLFDCCQRKYLPHDHGLLRSWLLK